MTTSTKRPDGGELIVRHHYNPSTLHMGDCSICGNVYDAPLHIGSPSEHRASHSVGRTHTNESPAPQAESALFELAARRVEAFSADGRYVTEKECDLLDHIAASIRALAPTTLTEQPSEAPPSAPDVRGALEWVRGEIFALCEATEDSARDGQDFSRGRCLEAKRMRRAMGEVIRERLAAATLIEQSGQK